MMFAVLNPQIITLLIYFLIIISIGLVAYYRTSAHADYVLGGRQFGPIVTALGVGASDMSGWLMLGLPGAAYLAGLGTIWYPVGLSIGAFLNWHFVAKRLRVATEQYNALTIPAFFGQYFTSDKPFLRSTAAAIILIFFTFYSAAGFVSGATLFTMLFDLDYHLALLYSAPVIIIYCVVGGFIAVNWVDVLQGILMLFALLLLPCVAVMHVQDWPTVLAKVPADYWSVSSTTWIATVSFLAWGLGYFGQPHILVRFMAAKDGQAIRIGKWICMTWMVLSLAAAVSIGLIGRMYYAKPLLTEPEAVFLKLSHDLFNPWVAGVLFAAVLSCIVSTIAAQLLLSASALVEDIYNGLCKPASDRNLIWLERATVLVVAAVAIGLAWSPESRILTLVGHAWAGLGACFGPVILFTLYSKRRLEANTVLFAMLAGAVTVITWLILQVVYGQQGLFGLYEIIPGFLVVSLILSFSRDKG